MPIPGWEYKWEGVVEYMDGDWSYCDKDKWKIGKEDIDPGKLEQIVPTLIKKWRILIKALTGKKVKKVRPANLLNWLSSAEETFPVKSKNMVVCLNNFIVSGNPFSEYRILSTVVGKNITVQITQEEKSRWFFLSFEENDWTALLEEYVIALWWFFLKISPCPN